MWRNFIYASFAVYVLMFTAVAVLVISQNWDLGTGLITALASIAQALFAGALVYFAKRTYDLNEEVMRVSGRLGMLGIRNPISQGKLSGSVFIINHARVAQTVFDVAVYIDGYNTREICMKDSKDSTKQINPPIRLEAGDAIEFDYDVELRQAGFNEDAVSNTSKYRLRVSTAYDRVERTLYDLSNPKDLYKARHNLD